jgi:spermidine/putrescine-binding protein
VTDEQFAAAAAWLRTAHQNVRAYWADPSELAQLMATGEVQVAWSWNDSIALMRAEGFPVGFQRQAKEGASSWFCGYVNFKDAPGSEDKAYDFINAWLEHGSARGCWRTSAMPTPTRRHGRDPVEELTGGGCRTRSTPRCWRRRRSRRKCATA